MASDRVWDDVSGDGGVLKATLHSVSQKGCGISHPKDGDKVGINYTGINNAIVKQRVIDLCACTNFFEQVVCSMEQSLTQI